MPIIPGYPGFLYLVTVMDWASRKVLSWRLSNTLDASFCVEALREALERYGPPPPRFSIATRAKERGRTRRRDRRLVWRGEEGWSCGKDRHRMAATPTGARGAPPESLTEPGPQTPEAEEDSSFTSTSTISQGLLRLRLQVEIDSIAGAAYGVRMNAGARIEPCITLVAAKAGQ